jgi:YVTN family beta-propeller protein
MRRIKIMGLALAAGMFKVFLGIVGRFALGFSPAGAARLTTVLVAAMAMAACCVGLSPAAAEEGIRTIPVGSAPLSISSDGTHVWVTNVFENTVSEIEASSGTVIRTIPVGSVPAGVTSDGTHVWVTNAGENTVSEIEASSGTVIRTIPVGEHPNAVSSDGTHVWVTNQYGTTINEINASSGEVIRTITTGSAPTGVSSDGTHVWVTNQSEATVSEIEASSGEVIRTIPVGRTPQGVFSDGTHVWVTSEEEDTVTEIEASSGTVIRTIPFGSYPRGVYSDGTHVWVGTYYENTVSEIEASSGTVIRTIPVGNGPDQVSSDGTHVWVSNFNEHTVSEFPTNYTLPPKAVIESPSSGGTYAQGALVTTRFSCMESEEGSGLESCTDSNGGSGTSGMLETSTLGPHTYTVTAKSKDGQTGTASISYTVLAPESCTGNTGTVTLSPGLTDTAKIQTMKIKGTLTGCTGTPFTGATYTATLKTAGPVSCSVLTGASEAATGAAKYKWTPKAKASTGTLSMPLTEAPDIAFSGEVTSGSYAPLTLSGTATESFTGGATCGEKVGNKATKAVKKGTFSGIISSIGR